MTDERRFKTFTGPADEAHLQFHGGRFVGFVFKTVDRWRAREAGARPRPVGAGFASRRVGNPSPRAAWLQASLLLALAAALIVMLLRAAITEREELASTSAPRAEIDGSPSP